MPRIDDDISNEILALVDGSASDSHESVTKSNSDNHSSDSEKSIKKSRAIDSLSNSSHSSEESDESEEETNRNSDSRYGNKSRSKNAGVNSSMAEVERESLMAAEADEVQKRYEKDEITHRLNRKPSTSYIKEESEESSSEGSDVEYTVERRSSRNRTKNNSALSKFKEHRKNKEIKKRDKKVQPTYDEIESEEAVEEVYSPVISKVEDLSEIIFDRVNLLYYCDFPNFNEKFVGCFVLLTVEIQSVFTERLAKIVDITDGPKSYTKDGSETNKILKVKHGEIDFEAEITIVSNNSVSPMEFSRFISAMEKVNEPPITFAYVQAKSKEIKEYFSQEVFEKEFDAILYNRRKVSTNPNMLNIWLNQLEKDKDLYENNPNPKVLEQYNADLAMIEERLGPHRAKRRAEAEARRIKSEKEKRRRDLEIKRRADFVLEGARMQVELNKHYSSDEEKGKPYYFVEIENNHKQLKVKVQQQRNIKQTLFKTGCFDFSDADQKILDSLGFISNFELKKSD